MRSSPLVGAGLAACALLILSAHGGASLKAVRLSVQPRVVVVGRQAAVLCQYDLEGAPLYSVKWYRGNLEFFRYSPGESSPYKVFPFPGIDVDVSSSNATQAVLRRVSFSLAGNFSCEVTTDGAFSTKTASATMTVVALPEGPPMLQTDRERYLPGDLLRANCSSPPSRPAAELDFFINGQPLHRRKIEVHIHGDTFRVAESPLALQTSWLSLRAWLLPSDFTDDRLLTLSCTARLMDVFKKSTELQLGYRPEPVPQRVTAVSAVHCACANLPAALLLAALAWYYR